MATWPVICHCMADLIGFDYLEVFCCIPELGRVPKIKYHPNILHKLDLFQLDGGQILVLTNRLFPAPKRYRVVRSFQSAIIHIEKSLLSWFHANY